MMSQEINRMTEQLEQLTNNYFLRRYLPPSLRTLHF